MAKKKAKTGPKKSYIVVWDNSCGDPVQVFNSLPEAKEFAGALVTRNQDDVDSLYTGNDSIDVNDVEVSSVEVYEGVLLGKAKASVVFE